MADPPCHQAEVDRRLLSRNLRCVLMTRWGTGSASACRESGGGCIGFELGRFLRALRLGCFQQHLALTFMLQCQFVIHCIQSRARAYGGLARRGKEGGQLGIPHSVLTVLNILSSTYFFLGATSKFRIISWRDCLVSSEPRARGHLSTREVTGFTAPRIDINYS